MEEKPLPKYRQRYKGQFTGHRCLPERWSQFTLLSKKRGLSANAALNRLVDQAIHRWEIPEYIENPQMPLEIPEKEQEQTIDNKPPERYTMQPPVRRKRKTSPNTPPQKPGAPVNLRR